MKKSFEIRILGVGIVFADLLCVLHMYYQLSIMQYMASKISVTIGCLASFIQSNGAEVSYVEQVDTLKSLLEIFEHLGNKAIWFYLTLIVGLLFCIIPQRFIRLFNIGITNPNDKP